MLVAIPSPVRKIDTSAGAIVDCCSPCTSKIVTPVSREGHAEVSPIPAAFVEISFADADGTHVLT